VCGVNDGRVVVNGNVFENRTKFDEILKIAKQQIKISNFFKRLMFWKNKNLLISLTLF
jgi:hypothetical protein